MRPSLTFLILLMTTTSIHARELFVYIGTYTRSSSKGIHVGRFDTATGRLGDLRLAAEVSNPSWLGFSPDRRFLYSVSEGAGSEYNGKPSGSVSAWRVDDSDGSLSLINTVPSAGRGACHLSVTPDGGTVLVANYSSGTVASLPVRPDGGLEPPASVDQHEGSSVHPDRQKGPHAHSITPSADGRFAYAANLGTDRIHAYRVGAGLELQGTTPLAPGSGPRHLAFAADSRHVYVINELSSTITTFSRNPEDGSLKPLQTIPTLPMDFAGKNTTAEIAVHPDGRFVYGSNRGHDSIAIFRAAAGDGTLTPAGHVSTQGRTPRHFALSPDGRWLIAANQDGDSLVIFSVDAETGALSPTGQSVTVGMPVCVKFR